MLENRMVIDELWNDEKEDLSEYYEAMEELEERIDNINLMIEDRELDILPGDNCFYTENDLLIIENDTIIQDLLEEKEMLNEELKEIENYIE